jgi:ATP-dependent RNA helicase RhlE
VLVATDIAARGIDVNELGHVVNFDVPQAPEDYIHRVGRTGRAEATGEAFTLVSPEEEGDLRDIEKAIGRRLPRVTVPDFDYNAKPQAKLEVPIAQRIAEIRARKREERARAEINAARRAANQRGHAPSSGNAGPSGRPGQPSRPGMSARPNRGPRRPGGGGPNRPGGGPSRPGGGPRRGGGGPRGNSR